MRRAMVGLLVAGLAWGGLSVPSAAALTLSGDEVVVWEPDLHPGLNSSTTLDIPGAGDLVLSAAGSVPATEARTLTDNSVEGEPALEGSASASHELYVPAAAGIAGTLTWPQGIRASEVTGVGSVTGGQTVTESFTPQVAGPASFELDWAPEKVTGQVVRTASGIGVSSSQQQSASSTTDDPPDWFEVNAKLDANGNPAPVQGLLMWQQPTVPTRNLDLKLRNLNTGETEVSNQLTGSEEPVSMAVSDSVTLAKGHLFRFEVINRSTETHDYTLAWEYHRLAEVHIALYDPDGTLVNSATGAVHGQTVTFDVPAEHEGRPYTVEITSQDHVADYDWTATYNIAAHAQVRLELLDRTDQVVATATDDDGDIDLSHVAPDSGAHTWRITNMEDDDRGVDFETPVPSYSLAEQIVLLDGTELGGVLPAGATSGGEVDVSDPGPMSASVTWDSVVGGMPIDAAATVGAGSSSTTAIRVTDDGPIEATLDWTQPILTTIDSGTITPGIEPTAEFAVAVRRTGKILVLLTHQQSLTADFVLELFDPDGTVVATAGPALDTIIIPSGIALEYTVADYTEGQGDYNVRVSTEGTGGDFDIDIDYPTTADLSLQLRRDGQIVDEVAGRGQTLTYDHTGEAADYQLRVVSADRAADYTLAGHYPAHAPLTATLHDPAAATVATSTADEGELIISADAPTAGIYTLGVTNDSADYDTPSYDATVLAPARADTPVDVALLDPGFNIVAELAAGQTQTIPVTAGQYRINATAPVTSRGHIEAYMAFDAAIDEPTAGNTIFATETISVTVEPGVTVDTIDLLIDGRLLTTLTGGATSHQWDTTLVNDGEHAITARVTDITDRIATAHTGVTVANALPAGQRLTADHQDGDLTDDEYALLMARVVVGDQLAPPYDVGIGHGTATSILDALSLWDTVSSTTQDALVDTLEFNVPPGAAPQEGFAAATTDHCTDEPVHIVLHIEADCAKRINGFGVVWRSVDFPDVDSETTVPSSIKHFLDGMEEADDVYSRPRGSGGLGLTRPFEPLVLFHPTLGECERCPSAVSIPEIDVAVETVGGNPALSPNIIVHPRWSSDRLPLRELGAHELFHTYQYEWVQLDLLVPVLSLLNGADHLQSVEWWMEASAEWATHHWGEDQSIAAGKRSYQGSIKEFLGTPSEALEGDSGDLSPGQPRYYGGFIVAEWLQSRDGADTIREVWEAVTVDPDTNSGVDPVQAFDIALDGGFGRTEVARMWRQLYMLDIASPGFVDSVETDVYRSLLDDGGVFSPGRMARQNLGRGATPLRTGATPSASGTIGRAGAKVFEFDTSPPSEPLTITVTGSSSLEAELLPLETYDTDPDGPETQCVFPQQSRSGNTITIELPATRDAPCEGYALILVNTSLQRGHEANYSVRMKVGQGLGGGELDTSRIRLGINVEGHLGVPGHDDAASRQNEDDPSAPIGFHNGLGLRLKATNWDSLSFDDDGWGVHDVGRGTAGYVPGGSLEPVGLTQIGATFTSDRVDTSSRAGSLSVRHSFEESADPHLIAVTTRLTNTSFAPTDIVYRRLSNWTLDFSNTLFPGGGSSREVVTVGAPLPRALPSEVLKVADGFSAAVTLDPRIDSDDSSLSDEIGLVTDHGPADLGTTFDIGFYDVGYLQTVTFTQYYGAAPSESDALAALRNVGAEAWAFGQDADNPSSGTPHTFIWGYRR